MKISLFYEIRVFSNFCVFCVFCVFHKFLFFSKIYEKSQKNIFLQIFLEKKLKKWKKLKKFTFFCHFLRKFWGNLKTEKTWNFHDFFLKFPENFCINSIAKIKKTSQKPPKNIKKRRKPEKRDVFHEISMKIHDFHQFRELGTSWDGFEHDADGGEVINPAASPNGGYFNK